VLLELKQVTQVIMGHVHDPPLPVPFAVHVPTPAQVMLDLVVLAQVVAGAEALQVLAKRLAKAWQSARELVYVLRWTVVAKQMQVSSNIDMFFI
jgi:hypothetical protein